MSEDSVAVHAIVVQRVYDPLLGTIALVRRGLLDGDSRRRWGGLSIDRRRDKIIHVHRRVGHNMAITHDQGLLEPAWSGKDTRPVKFAVTGDQQVAQASAR